MKKDVNILIVDDHPIFRRGLRDILRSERKMNIVADVANGAEALSVIKKHSVDVVILDLDMPVMNCFEFTQAIRRQNIPVKIIILTMHKEESIFARALDLGIKAFVNKENAATDIIKCIKAISKDQSYICPMFADFLENRGGQLVPKSAPGSGLDLLTPAERKVLKLIAENKSSKQIADELFISPKTVDNHRTNICAKLNLHGTHALLRFLLDNKSLI